jgi:hypothetical protein
MPAGDTSRIVGLLVHPPMAVARLGSSGTPLEAFEWFTARGPHSLNQTLLRPAVSFEILPDSSIRPYLPGEVRFKEDDGAIRPVAPFFELWAEIQSAAGGECHQEPLTLSLLRKHGLSVDHLWFRVTAANRKAQRRTGSASCACIARVESRGSDYQRKALLGISPHTQGQQPLVMPDHPIPLGWFQLIRPVEHEADVEGHKVDLAVIRLRITPAKGKVYGPPAATTAPASPLQPGQALPPACEYGRIHEIVPEQNRILSPNTPWSKFVMMKGHYLDTLPYDSYEGANVGENISWAVLDDACDGLIEATLASGFERLRATARFFSGPPAFAPDHRPFYSVADDLADRDEPPPVLDQSTFEAVKNEIVGLFRRAFDVASLLNLDAARSRAIEENAMWLALAGDASQKITGANALWLAVSGGPPLPESELSPKIGQESLTAKDKPYVDKTPPLLPGQQISPFSRSAACDPLPYTKVVPFVHSQFLEEPILLDFLREHAAHVRRLMRPPFASWSELPERAPTVTSPHRRDPRLFRDKLHDMRMPPYMRDSNFYPLSLTRRQYITLMAFLDYLEQHPKTAQPEPAS